MTIDFGDMVKNEQRKALMLMQKALELDIPLDECIQVGVNEFSGNVWLWHCDYDFSLYIGLSSDTIWISTMDENGNEHEIELDSIFTVECINEWVADVSDQNCELPY